MNSAATPSWFNRLPDVARQPGKKVVIVDNQVLSYRLLDHRKDPDYDFLFEDSRLILQIGRQVIDETLHSVGIDDHGFELDANNQPVLDRRGRPIRIGPVIYRPGLPGGLHERMWTGMAQLQERGKLVMVGGMYPAQRVIYDRFAAIIENACGRRMGPKDARLMADALVRGIPLFSGDNRARAAFVRAMTGAVLSTELRNAGLTAVAANMFVP